MPPKNVQGKVDKIVEDKTFGLKNKNKSKKVQQFVQSVQKSAQTAVRQKAGLDKPRTIEEKLAEDAKKAKAAKAALEKEMNALLRASIKQPPLEPGVDPKSVVCEFFKRGVCEKGEKCKFSHDLTVGRKAAKIDLYSDRRDEEGKETNADWDQAKLEEVVNRKSAAETGKGNRTDIVCMYFLDAIEKEIYGWFWKCPNGEDCKYRHCLPPGYVYKTKAEREAEAAAKANAAKNQTALEELIEEERKKLPTEGLTPVTAESFAKWKEDRAKRKAAEAEAKRAEEVKKATKAGNYNAMSGRALFTYDPSLFVDDDGADNDAYSVHEEEEGEAVEGGGGAASGGGDGSGVPVGDEALFLAGGEEDLDDLDDLPDDDEEEEGGGGGAGGDDE